MSIPVDLSRLPAALADFGSGYLLSTREGRIKIVTVDPVVDGADLRISGPGRGTLANVAANEQVSLAFPPGVPRGYSLIVDAIARVDGEDVVLSATGAVLHRPSAHAEADPDAAPGATGCGHDCQPL